MRGDPEPCMGSESPAAGVDETGIAFGAAENLPQQRAAVAMALYRRYIDSYLLQIASLRRSEG